ncbi:26S proteasome regulatory subunit 6B, partial [Tanacetum coccineum]
MLAKAVANHTTAAFIRVVGSEFVQKYLGEGPRMVRDVFRLAKENAPAIIFIDEVDAIATARFDAQTGADREVQRILMELLNQMDGFDQTVNVKVIMATNRADTLDPALLRPGRLDRKIEFPLPDRRQKRLVFQVCTAKMNLSDEVDLEDYVSRPDKISAAEITAICQEAGMHAVRKNRYVILPKDFEKGYRTNPRLPVSWRGNDDNFLCNMRALLRPVSWLGNDTEHMIAATCNAKYHVVVNHSLLWESVVYCLDWLPVCMYDLHLKPLFTRSIPCNLGTVKNVQLADKKSHTKIQCPNAKTMGHNQHRSTVAPFNIGENCGNQPSDISCSAITTFVHARLQELHFNSPEQCQLNKRNGKFTEDGIQKAFAK